MFKVANLVLDVYSDHGCEVARTLPADLHTVKVASADEVARLPDRCFGLVLKTASGEVKRYFPLHDADAVKLSSAYFERTRNALPGVVQEACHEKIVATQKGEGYAKVAYVDLSTVKTAEKVTFPDRFYGLTLGDQNHFPLHDDTLVKRALARFPYTTDGMDPQYKFAYARNIAKRASQLGVEVPHDSKVHWYTNDELNQTALKQAIDQRKMAVASREDVSTEVLDQLALAAGCPVKQGELEHPHVLMARRAKLASFQHLGPAHVIATLEAFDKVANLTAYEYNRGLLDPYAACFKSATHGMHGALVVDGVDLGTITPEAMAANFDPDFIAEFQKSPLPVYHSLPDPMKALMRNLAGAAVAKPACDEGSSLPSGETLTQLAPSYANQRIIGD